jgi:hypothetical protein
MLRKLFAHLFGSCLHEWGPWREKFEGSSYQRRQCSKCGKAQQRWVGW